MTNPINNQGPVNTKSSISSEATGSLAPARTVIKTAGGDVIVTASGQEVKAVIPDSNNPQAPVPTTTAIQTIETTTKILRTNVKEDDETIDNANSLITEEEVRKFAADIFKNPPEEIEIPVDEKALSAAFKGTPEFNPYIQAPNVTAALVIAMINYLANLNKTRTLDRSMQQELTQSLYKLGLDNANMAKEIRMLEASKERLEAYSKFASAVIAVTQAASITIQRGQLEKKYYNQDPVGDETMPDGQINYAKRVKNAENNLEDFKGRLPKSTSEASTKFDPTKLTPDEKAEFDKLTENLHQAQSGRDRSYQDELHYRMQVSDSLFRGASNVVEGSIAMFKSCITQEQANLEKIKAMNEALMQLYNRAVETLQKNADDAASQYDKFLQMMVQWYAETRPTFKG